MTKHRSFVSPEAMELIIPVDSIPIYVDNNSLIIKLASNTKFDKRSKHINLIFQLVHDVVSRQAIKI